MGFDFRGRCKLIRPDVQKFGFGGLEGAEFCLAGRLAFRGSQSPGVFGRPRMTIFWFLGVQEFLGGGGGFHPHGNATPQKNDTRPGVLAACFFLFFFFWGNGPRGNRRDVKIGPDVPGIFGDLGNCGARMTCV